MSLTSFSVLKYFKVLFYSRSSHATNKQCFHILVGKIHSISLTNKFLMAKDKIDSYSVNMSCILSPTLDRSLISLIWAMRHSPRLLLPVFCVKCFLIHDEREECFLVTKLGSTAAAPLVTEHGNYWHLLKTSLAGQIAWFELPIVLCTFNGHLHYSHHWEYCLGIIEWKLVLKLTSTEFFLM